MPASPAQPRSGRLCQCTRVPGIPGRRRQRILIAVGGLAAQRAAASEIQRTVFDEAPYLPSGQYFSNTAFRRSITEPISEIFAFWEVRRV